MDIWGHCEDCERWFYCPTGAHAEPDWACPVCGAEPMVIENRAAQSA